jgi:hypothetical protein
LSRQQRQQQQHQQHQQHNKACSNMMPAHMPLVVLLVWVDLAAKPVKAQASGNNRTSLLGILHRRSNSDGGWLGPYWDGVSCAAVLAVRHANTRNGSVVPDLARLTRTNINAYHRDTGSVPFSGIGSYRQLVWRGAHAVVGAARSAVSTPLAQLGAVDEMPMMSYWSSSPSLSDKSIYSHFARTFPSDNEAGTRMCAALSRAALS